MSERGKSGQAVIFTQGGKTYATTAISVPQQLTNAVARELVRTGQAVEIVPTQADQFPWLKPPRNG